MMSDDVMADHIRAMYVPDCVWMKYSRHEPCFGITTTTMGNCIELVALISLIKPVPLLPGDSVVFPDSSALFRMTSLRMCFFAFFCRHLFFASIHNSCFHVELHSWPADRLAI
jgi:hypothetical protein